ncbi:hypothetical protein CY35_15G006300 [Sphagnum magellanicum]|nr:hypothetical protein CY35_15G006300 [Sphagnum magellanicum]
MSFAMGILSKQKLSLCVLVFLSLIRFNNASYPDSWQVIVPNGGVSAMHTVLLHTNKLVIFDRTDYGPSQIRLPDGTCRNDPNDRALKVDCWAHSVELDLATNLVRPLEILTDTWCSSGAVLSDGTLKQTGGWNDGGSTVRTIGDGPTDNWVEFQNQLAVNRWYSSDQLLPDQTIIIVGGRAQFNYEFVPRAAGQGTIKLPFLAATDEAGAENNLYPFTHLLPDGNLYIFANRNSILLNYKTGQVVRTYPQIPDGPRNYPSSGSSVMLPLSAANSFTVAEIMICGGAPVGAFQAGNFTTALQSCGRLVVTELTAPQWVMSLMPMPRVMGDMLILPTGEILIINGAQQGTAGWGNAKTPVLTPVLYNPTSRKFQVMRPTNIPRLYHSTAVVLPSGEVFVGGSNPNEGYVFTGVPFPTELRYEKYRPYYLNAAYNPRRPTIVQGTLPTEVVYGTTFQVSFTVGQVPSAVVFRLYFPSFTTHTFSQNQRSLVLQAGTIVPSVAVPNQYTATVAGCPNAVICPAGYYLFTIINFGTPSASVWIHIG